jgi:hypothetical protein
MNSMTPIRPADLVRVNNVGDLMMNSEVRPYVGEVLDVVKIAKSGLVVLAVPSGTISVPRTALTLLKMSSFSGMPASCKKVTGPVQVFEDKFPHG